MAKKEKKNSIFKEFSDFINKGNALALAIGVIIGSCFTAIVTSINKNIISPLIGALIGDLDLSNSLVTVLATEQVTNSDTNTVETVVTNAIYWGKFIQSVIDFLLTAIILFTIYKLITAIINKANKVKELALKRFVKEEQEEEVVKEEVVIIPEDVKLLTEIRDLLANKENK